MEEQLTEEQRKKKRRREYSYAHFMKTRCKGREKATVQPKYEIVYFAWVIPLVGDPIQIGPFKSKHVTLKARYRTVRRLMEKKNAKDLDIRLLGMYEKGLLEDSD